MPPTSSDLTSANEFLALARKVKTAQGQDRFDQPIGQPIAGEKKAPAAKKSASPVRLKSLNRQVEAARATGSEQLLKEAQEAFRAEFLAYARATSMDQALTALDSASEKEK